MFNNKHKGNIGEDLARKFLISKGFAIFARNFKTEIGEIDIVAGDKDTLVFVEVKLRSTEAYGLPSDAVNRAKVRKLSQVASQYLLKHRLFHASVRFDVIEIFVDERRINHIENAFDSYLSY